MRANSIRLLGVSIASISACLAVSGLSGAVLAQDAVTLPNPVDADTVIEQEPVSQAQPQTADPEDAIIVRGLAERQSSWKRAETELVVIYSNGSESRIREAAEEVHQLHYLMSKIFDRLDAVDETQKLEITLIGNDEFMQSMRLTNWRAAEGPFGGPVQNQRYYNPRIDGAKMAVTRADLYFSAASGGAGNQFNEFLSGPSIGDDLGGDDLDDSGFSDDPSAFDFVDESGGDQERPWEQALLAGYAQHYVTTYLPEAYPRWYIDSIGALFSTVRLNDDGELEYGRSPPAFRGLYNHSQEMDLAELLTTGEAGEDVVWSSHHAWLLGHFFFLSPDNPERKMQLAQYMGAIANGRTLAEAATVFGDLERFQKEVDRYGVRRTRYAKVEYEPMEDVDPVISSLGVTEAAVMDERLQLDSRLILPSLTDGDTTSEDLAELETARDAAKASRDKWMADLRDDVAQLSPNANALLLLAEAECRLGNYDACIRAADEVIAEFSGDTRAPSWKAIALIQQAADSPPNLRQDRVKAARALVKAANRVDPDAVMPLVAYFRSFTDIGEAAPEEALFGMLRVIQLVPNAPEPRLLLGQELLRQSRADAARQVMLPLLNGPWDSPERQMALRN